MMKTDAKIVKQEYHSLEEKLNSFTHSIGAGLSIAGMIFLLVLTRMKGGSAWHYLSFVIYGSFQILLYLTSSLTHLFTDHPKINKIFRAMDQAAIFLLIAGTFTPILLTVLRGPRGWTLLGLVWGFAIAGILLKSFVTKGVHLMSDFLYLLMGWLVVFAWKPMKMLAPPGLLMWIAIGGTFYTLGIVFYMVKKIPMSHVIWHLFVLGGGISFYLGFAYWLL